MKKKVYFSIGTEDLGKLLEVHRKYETLARNEGLLRRTLLYGYMEESYVKRMFRDLRAMYDKAMREDETRAD